MNAPALSGDSTRIVPDFLSYSFWDILDMHATFGCSMKKLKEAYNNLLPTRKGRLREPEYTIAKIIVHLLGHEMEQMRKNDPTMYKLYLSGQMDCLPVSTNRGQLRTMMDDEYSLRSYSNFINRLMDAGIILRKRNTSRVFEKTVDVNGVVRKKIKMTKGGRGDFILYINKKALTFLKPLKSVSKSKNKVENTAKSTKSELADNQRLTSGQVQKMQLPHDVLSETKRINNNKRINVDNAATEPLNSLIAAIASKNGGSRDGDGKLALFESSGAATPEAMIYVEKFEKDRRIARELPKKEKEFYCKLLFAQLSKTVYSKYTNEYMERIEPHAKNLLRLHLQRLNKPIAEAFQIVSRAIYLTKRYLDTHSAAYIYDPMTWLRTDDEYQSGTLKTVVDEWIPREERRLFVYDKKRSTMVRWQYAVRFSDKVFLEVVKALKTSFSLGLQATNQAFIRLDNLFEKYDLPPSAKKELRKRFADRTYAILKELDKIGTLETDAIWATFERHQKLVKKGS